MVAPRQKGARSSRACGVHVGESSFMVRLPYRTMTVIVMTTTKCTGIAALAPRYIGGINGESTVSRATETETVVLLPLLPCSALVLLALPLPVLLPRLEQDSSHTSSVQQLVVPCAELRAYGWPWPWLSRWCCWQVLRPPLEATHGLRQGRARPPSSTPPPTAPRQAQLGLNQLARHRARRPAFRQHPVSRPPSL
jgi:hypothetical protein